MEKGMTTLRAAFTAALLLVIGSTNANANSWRINNDVTKMAHFTSINAAMSSADVVAGDTLYLDPGCVCNGQTINKSVTIIGTGWGSKAHNVANLTSTTTITAANTKLEGVYCKGIVALRANYITLERCKIEKWITNSTSTAQFATIRQCRIYDYIEGNGATSNNSIGWTIENNVISSGSSSGTVRDLYNCTIRNNYIYNTYTGTSYTPSALKGISGGLITNNILLNAKTTKAQTLWSVTNSTVQGNVLSSNETMYADIYPDNVCLDLGYAEAETALVVKTGEDILYYQLKADSPARGAGTVGEDCGPFAGNYPMVIYGRPYGIPYFEESQVGSRAVDGKVSMKQKVVIQND
jgi:hypothetical protein